MDRRAFLKKGISFVAGGLCGWAPFSRALAMGQRPERFCRPQIALIIDDIGYSLSRARLFYRMGAPMTFSILPRLSYSYHLAQEIHHQGQEVMLHQPMEPYNAHFDPGPGALYTGFKWEKIVQVVRENIAEVPFINGVNNHMGSRFTSSQKEIAVALKVIQWEGLFFIDSVTSTRTKAYQTARYLHMATARRDVFLDNRRQESLITDQLLKLKRYALTYGSAIGIGHPFPETAQAIRRFIKYTDPTEIAFVPASRVIYA